MNRKITLSKLCLLLVFMFSTQAFPKTSEINIVGTTLPDTISVEGGLVGDSWRSPADGISLQEYIRGVVRSEMGKMGPTDDYATTIIEAYKAQAVAAATNLKERVNAQTDNVVVPNSTNFQTYLSAAAFKTLPITELSIETAADPHMKTIIQYDSKTASVRYFHGTKSGFTLNSYECGSNGRWYNPYMSRQVTPEKLQNKYPNISETYSEHAGDGCGMSQVGAAQIALLGRNYAGILKYYYGTMPPYVKKVYVDQDGIRKYQVALEDNVSEYAPNTNSTIRKWTEPERVTLGAAKETTISVSFSDLVDKPDVYVDDQGFNADEIDPHGGIVPKNTPVDTWKVVLTAKELADIKNGKNSLRICTNHKSSGQGLDSNPKTMAFKKYSDNSVGPETQYEEGCDSSVQLYWDKGKPWITVGSLYPLYNEFTGTSNLAPSTVETAHTIAFGDTIVGVSSATIDGPAGNIAAWYFDPPVLSSSAYFSYMSPGQYNVTVINTIGEETNTPFTIDDLDSNISLLESAATLNCPHDYFGTCTYTANIVASASSTSLLKKIELLNNSNGAILASQDINAKVSTVTIVFSTNTIDYLYLNLRVTDIYNNYKMKTFFLWPNLFVGPYITAMSAFPVPIGANSETPILDIVASTPAMLPGSVLESYVSPETDTRLIHTFIGPFYKSAPIGDREDVGHIKLLVRTGDLSDLSDAIEYIVSDRDLFFSHPFATGGANNCMVSWGYTPEGGTFTFPTGQADSVHVCYEDSAPAQKIILKRYVQTKVEITPTNPSSIIPELCGTVDPENPTICSHGGYVLPGVFKAGPEAYGVLIDLLNSIGIPTENKNIPLGDNTSVNISSSVKVNFNHVYNSDSLALSLATSRVPNGYTNASNGVTYEIIPGGALSFGNAELEFPFDVNLSQGQKDAIKVVKVVDPATGKYDDLQTTLKIASNTVSCNTTTFGKFMVVAPEYSTPTTTAQGNINGKPELEYISNIPATSAIYPDPSGNTLAALKSANELPVTNVYSISADTTTEASGAITMRYSAAVLVALGLGEESLAIYSFSEAGDLVKLSDQTIDKNNKVLTAKVHVFEFPLFAVLVSSVQLENIERALDPDITGPIASINYSGAVFASSDTIFISSGINITLSAVDPNITGEKHSGMTYINYVVDPASDTVLASTYTDPLILPEGAHELDCNGVDNAMNDGALETAKINVDATPPHTEFLVMGSSAIINGSLFVSGNSSLALSVIDPLSNGVASGPGGTYCLVDDNFLNCPNLQEQLNSPPGQPPVFSGDPGTCDNPIYSNPFTLLLGTHTVQYFSIDKVHNRELPKFAEFTIIIDTVAPMAALVVAGSTLTAGTTAYISEKDFVTLIATDPVVGNYTSGVKRVLYWVDVRPDTCQPPTYHDLSGTCDNPVYTSPFTLHAGTHTISYTAEDKLGNIAKIKSVSFSVSPVGPLAPSFSWVGISSMTAGWKAVSGASYVAVLSTNSDYSKTVSSSVVTTNFKLFTGLAYNTSYYFEVKLSTEPNNKYIANRISTTTQLPIPTLVSITPKSALNTADVNITSLVGTNFYYGATVKLTRTGYADIYASTASVIRSTQIACTLPLAGVPGGVWNVAVVNPDGKTATLANAFTGIAVTPLSPSFSAVNFSSMTVDWYAVPRATYVVVLSSISNYSKTVSSSAITATSKTFTGLNYDTTYYFEVKLSTENDAAYQFNRIYTATLELSTPTVTALAPDWATTSSSPAISLAGTNFYTGAKVKLSRAGYTDVYASTLNVIGASQITSTFPIVHAAGVWDVTVLNTDGKSATSPGGLTVYTGTILSPSLRAIGVSIATVSWKAVNGAQYTAVLSTDRAYENIVSSEVVTSTSDVFSGLMYNTSYYFEVKLSTENDAAYSLNKLIVHTNPLPAPTLTSVALKSALNNADANITSLVGTNFYYGATVKLTRTGYADIYSSTASVIRSTQMACTLPLAGAPGGVWNMAVVNPDGKTATLANTFMIVAVTPLNPAAAAVDISQITVDWYAVPRATYVVVLSTMSNYAKTISSSAITTNSRTFTGLNCGTTYYFEVKLATETDAAYQFNRLFTVTPALSTPTITSVTPTWAVAIASPTVSLAGTGFYAGARVKLSRTGYADIYASTLTVVSPERIVCTFPIIRAVGAWDVTIINPDGKYAVLPEGLTVYTATPLSPVLRGIGISSAAVRWALVPGAEYTVVLATDIAFSNIISSGVVTSTGQAFTGLMFNTSYYFEVKLSTENDAAYSLNRLLLHTNPLPAPTLTSITPKSAINTADVNITSLVGTNFFYGARVKLTRTGYTDIYSSTAGVISPTQMTCTLPITSAAGGAWNVAVVNPDGKTATLSNGFNVLSITPLSPSFRAVYATSMTAVWTIISNAKYVAVLASNPGYTGIISSSTITSYSKTFTGLTKDTTYYFEVKLSTEVDAAYLVNRSSVVTDSPPITTPVLPANNMSLAGVNGGTMPGTPFTLNGFSFGRYSSARINGRTATRVMIDGLWQCILSFWSDTRVRGIIPDGIMPGGHTVFIQREGGGDVQDSNSVGLTVDSGGYNVSTARMKAPAEVAAEEDDSGAGLPIMADWDAHVEAANRAAVDIPAHAMSDDNYVVIEDGNADADTAAAMLRSEGVVFATPVGPLTQFGPDGLQFSLPVIITLPYDASSIPAGKTEADLAIFNWDDLAGAWLPLPTSIVNGRAQASVQHFSMYQVMATGVSPLASAAFSLKQFYVYPNPSKDGIRPTLHLEVGLADSVDIRIYDFAGDLRHNAKLSGTPQVSSPEYAYEYAWDTAGAGSGVYIAVVEAQKGGASIKTKKKFAIIK